ncbi:hypothetical protein WN55_02018 [Dufourea novaeangliae]|uniref:Uncharacterized protein n=1 Tax=Dufourea novaeangliae TaxID=178035 RepID=A0A154NX44_DUFNO|nr:hypothetical protein WN55_02018 [Dufourea novaeangliae]
MDTGCLVCRNEFGTVEIRLVSKRDETDGFDRVDVLWTGKTKGEMHLSCKNML